MSTLTERYNNNFTILREMSLECSDTIDVKDGCLQLKKGTASFSYFQSQEISNPHPSALGNHFETLIDSTVKEYFNSLQTVNDDTPEHYDQVSLFNRDVKRLCRVISDLQYQLRSRDSTQAKHYSQLFDKASTLRDEIKKYKKTLAKPAQPRVEHAEYNERTELRSIKPFHSKHVSPQSTRAAALKALQFAKTRKSESVFNKCFRLITSIPSVIATVLKIVLWNPIEWLIRGEIRTESPYQTFLLETEGLNRHMDAFQSYVGQLLRQPQITEEVADVFAELAPDAKCLDLNYADLAAIGNVTDLKDYIKKDEEPGAFPLDTFLEKLDGNELPICLDDLNLYYRHINVAHRHYLKENKPFPLDDYFSGKVKRINKPSKGSPFINPQSLFKLLDAAAKSPTCKEIKLSSSLAELSDVRDFLKKHSYTIKEDKQFHKTFYRTSPF